MSTEQPQPQWPPDASEGEDVLRSPGGGDAGPASDMLRPLSSPSRAGSVPDRRDDTPADEMSDDGQVISHLGMEPDGSENSGEAVGADDLDDPALAGGAEGAEEPPFADEDGILVVSAEEMEPASVLADVPDGDAATSDTTGASASAGASSTDDSRWGEVVAGFIDDPRSSVRIASVLLEDDVAAFAESVRQRRTSMLDDSPGDDAGSTEDMRQVLLAYRHVSRQLTEKMRALG